MDLRMFLSHNVDSDSKILNGNGKVLHRSQLELFQFLDEVGRRKELHALRVGVEPWPREAS